MKVKEIILDYDEQNTCKDFGKLLVDICMRVNGMGNCIGNDCPCVDICSGYDNSIEDFCRALSEHFDTIITTER